MAKPKPSIKWRKKDVELLNKKIANYNRKINRIIKQNPELAEVMPEKENFKNIKQHIEIREDFNYYIDKLSSFTQRKAETIITNEKGEKATVFSIRQANKAIEKANKYRKEKTEKLKNDVYINGQKATNVRRTIIENNNKPLALNFQNKEKGTFKNFVKYVETQVFNERYRNEEQQYLYTLKLAVRGGYTKQANIEKMCNIFDKIGGKLLLELYNQSFDEFTHDFHYDHLKSDDFKINNTLRVLNGIKEK